MDKVKLIDSSGSMVDYVKELQTVQRKLTDLDPGQTNQETLALADMTRLLDNLTGGQKEKSTLFYRKEKWRNRNEATHFDVFDMGRKLIEIFPDSNVTESYAKNKVSGEASATKENFKICHKHRNSYRGTGHSWDLCDLNPNTTDQKEKARRAANRKNWNGGKSNGSGSVEFKKMKASVAAMQKNLDLQDKKYAANSSKIVFNSEDEIDAQIESLEQLLAQLSANSVNAAGTSYSCY